MLCELLPVGIPSLAICLQTLVNGELLLPPLSALQHPWGLHPSVFSWPSPGGFTEETRRKVLEVLGFQSMQLEQSTWCVARRVHGGIGCWVQHPAWALPSSCFPCSEGRGAFPGAEIYHMVEQLNRHLKESITKMLDEER